MNGVNMKKLNYKFITSIFILIIVLLPNFSNAAKISVDKVTNVSSANVTTSSAVINWRKIKDVMGYKVYLYNDSNGKYEFYKTVYTNTIKLTNLKSSKRYKLKVRAYKKKSGTKYYGAYSGIYKFTTIPDQINNITMEKQTENSIQIKWDTVKRIDAYKVYIMNEKTSKFEYYASTTNNYLNITNLQSAKVYKVRVRAYKKFEDTKYYGKYSVAKEIITLPSKILNLRMKENTSKEITITWDKAQRVLGYRIYRYNESSKGWEYLGKTPETYYKIAKSSKREAYKFRVRAYLKFNDVQYYGAYSDWFSTRIGIDVSAYKKDFD